MSTAGRPRHRVLHVLWRGDVGGAPRSVYQLAMHQRASGVDVAVAFGQGVGYFSDLARGSGLRVEDLDLRCGSDLPGAMRARSALQRYGTHHFHVAEPALMLASMTCRGVRRVYTHRAGLSAYGGRRALRYRLLRHILGKGWAITGTAQAAVAAEQLFGRARADVLPTMNAIDLDLFAPQAAPTQLRAANGVGSGEVVIGTAAELRAWKRIDWLIEAAAGLRATNWRIWILGDGDDRARLEQLAAASPVADRIRFLGMRQDITDWLHALDVFVLPSGREESFGNAVVEAMACGLPVVVAADSPAHMQHVADEGTGFAADDPAHLARLLDALIADAELRQETGRRGRAFVVDRYSVPRMLEGFEAAYAAADR